MFLVRPWIPDPASRLPVCELRDDQRSLRLRVMVQVQPHEISYIISSIFLYRTGDAQNE